MDDRVVEPSEILIDREGLPREDTTRVNPWIRFLARFFDYALFFLVLLGIHAFLGGETQLNRVERLIPFEFFSWIPVETLLLCTWGTTPGKFFLKTQLHQGKRTRLELISALKRSFNVWFRGLGMGIPLINFFCLLVAYQRLQIRRQTSWDREENIVVKHKPFGRWRLVAAVLVILVGFSLYYREKSQAPLPSKSTVRV